MRPRANRSFALWPMLALCIFLTDSVEAENIDADSDGSQYAWAENVGWLNAEPNGDGADGVHVTGSALTGWMWGENIGWVSLSCTNRASCGTVSYGVSNDNCGTLSGYAWAENVGWINFSPTTAGVTIDPKTGDFSGEAWGENIGWISFASTGTYPHQMTTGWYRTVPTANPAIGLSKSGSDLVITWTGGGDAEAWDVFQGSLTSLRTTGGDYSAATTDCRAEDQVGTTYQQSMSVGTAADFFLVRGVNCGGNGTCDCGGSGQVGLRDSEIGSSGTCL